MKFQSGKRRRALEYEKDWAARWKANGTFEKSVEQRPASDSYVFYDGPPFITGVPHHGTLLSSIVKDAIPRYQTMKGKRVERVWGWDCHGLPAENYTEKKLGISDRHDIGTKVSLEEYITAARDNMVSTGNLWEDTIARIGRWVDFKGAYKTMDKDYMESVWWAFKTLYDKGKIYEGEKVLMYDTKWATPLSKAEVTMDAGAYQTVTDPSVYVKFRIKRWEHDGKPVYFLAWTTTPWTLPANTALGIGAEELYSELEVGDERFIIHKDLVAKVMTDEKHQPLEYKVVHDGLKGSMFIGLEYEPLLDVNRGKGAHFVWDYPGISAESGTGIVHLAPAYGEEDFVLARQNGIPVVHVLDDYGVYTEGDWKDCEVWESNKRIAKELKERGNVWKIDYYRHEYPHNPRTGQRLMYRAHPSWFFDIDGQRTEMFEQNSSSIDWFPEHIKHGRFEKTIETAPDWNLSRDRFWATAMPVWKGDRGTVRVIGSYAELKELSGVELDDYHRPWVDDITFSINGEHFTRIDKVLDCWFESGSMSFAQFHYPFENKEKFESNFPGDFIAEYVGQVRAWFYYLHAVNVGLFGTNAFKNVIVTGNVAGNDGRKMSKSYGNFTDPNELMDKYSADSLRFLLLSSPLLSGEDFALQDKDVGDIARKLGMIWNMYDFFTMYAAVDGWEYDGTLTDPLTGSVVFLETALRHVSLRATASDEARAADVSLNKLLPVTNPLDIWIVSRLHQLIAEVEKNMNGYNLPDALSPILPFLDDASNWYVRRSRRRFWKSDSDRDKNDAYRTLHYVLVRLAYVLAPFTPFLAEELYYNLTGDEESIHLKDWLSAGQVNELVLDKMSKTRSIIEYGLMLRMRRNEETGEEQRKVRQPLAKLSYSGEKLGQYYEDIIAEEVNVKVVLHEEREGQLWVEIEKKLTRELKREGLMREVIRHVQAARKAAGLNVDDRIRLGVVTEDIELQEAMREHAEAIEAETLATSIQDSDVIFFETTVKVEGKNLLVTIVKGEK